VVAHSEAVMQVDTATGEIREAGAVRVLPVYGSEAWRTQVREDFD